MKNSENSKSSSLVNPHFELVVMWIQANIGKVIVALLVMTYLGTALMIATSLQDALKIFGPTLSWIGASITAVLAQMIRGSLVYFNQANPYRVSSYWEYLGIVFAFILTVFACFEVHHLFVSQGIGIAGEISVVGLIIAGFFLEAYFLGEINRTNRSLLIENPDLIQQAIKYEQEYAEMIIAIGEAKIDLHNAKRRRLSGALQRGRSTGNEQTPTPSDSKEEKALPKPKPEPESIFDFSENGHSEKN